jgi:Kef-type K+ transport system membrane component KefB
MSTSETFLIAMAIIFSIPYFVWRIFRTDYYAPLVVVQIIGGILLGPGVLGAVFPDYYNFVFTPPVIAQLNGIAQWAVMIFVWIAGIELDIHLAWRHRRETGITAGLALGVPLLFGCGAALIMMMLGGGWIGPRGHTWQLIVGIGMACAVTALPILVLFMEKLAILRQPLGQRILRYASLDDVAIWGVLALILLDWERVGRQLGFLLCFGVTAFLVRKIMWRIPERDRWYAGLFWLALAGFAADWSGLHFMVGAFLSGAVLDASMFNQERMDQFRAHVLLAIMPVFFLSTGLRTTWEMGGLVVFGAGAILLVSRARPSPPLS